MAETERLQIDGMTCQNCVAHVTKALKGVKGVKTAQVSLESGAIVTGKTLDRGKLIAAVVDAGYGAS